jgi:Putative enzyme of poly-gamma-glutamate biosynthesis (capsule formation)
MRELFSEADVVIGNLEGAVGEVADSARSKNSLLFDIRKGDIGLLYEAGFDILTIENNHIYDLGEEGKDSTVVSLQKSGLVAVHNKNSPHFFTAKGVVVSIIAVNTISNKEYTADEIPSIELMQQLRLAKNLSNVVIVSIHWGSELVDWRVKQQRNIAEWLAQNGADIIIGSHPHVIQQPEVIDGKPVFYSLGNYLFDQKYDATKEGLIADIRIKNGKIKCTGIITRTAEHSFYPRVVREVDYGFKAIETNKLFKIGEFTLLPVSENSGVDSKIRLDGYSADRKVWSSQSIPLVSIETGKLDGENEHLFTLEKHYSTIDNETDIRPYVYGTDIKGIHAIWRGSALAWPLVDAHISKSDSKTLCVLHRGDSYINIDKNTQKKRLMSYRWNGFGFSGVTDSVPDSDCDNYYASYLK